MRFRLVAKLVTLNNLERRNGRYFEHHSGSPSTTTRQPTYFKLAFLVYKAQHGRFPQYFRDDCQLVTDNGR